MQIGQIRCIMIKVDTK